MILNAGKRLENREWKFGPTWRGPFLLHASSWWSKYAVYEEFLIGKSMATIDAWDRIVQNGPVTLRQLMDQRGCIVGRAILDGLLYDEKDFAAYAAAVPGADDQHAWWCDGFALVMREVQRIDKPIHVKGSLGFFDVPESTIADARWEPCEP
jgi:hypothetical protein